jgi:hypothetical protein
MESNLRTSLLLGRAQQENCSEMQQSRSATYLTQHLASNSTAMSVSSSVEYLCVLQFRTLNSQPQQLQRLRTVIKLQQYENTFLTKKNCCLKFRSVHYWQHGTTHGKNILQQQHKAVFWISETLKKQQKPSPVLPNLSWRLSLPLQKVPMDHHHVFYHYLSEFRISWRTSRPALTAAPMIIHASTGGDKKTSEFLSNWIQI